MAILFLDLGTGRGWVVSTTPRPLYPRKDPVPIVQEAGWAPGPVWTSGKSPARSQLLYRPSYPAPDYRAMFETDNDMGIRGCRVGKAEPFA
jgi:hypothetical protein